MTKLTREQYAYLKEQRKKLIDFRLTIIEKYTPAIFENIKQIRETIRNLCITSGAIAALTINLLDKAVVKNKSLSFISVSIFLFVVWEGFFYLKLILERENKQLSRKTDQLHTAITKTRRQIDKAIKDNSQEEAAKFIDAFKEIEKAISQEDRRIDNWFVKYIGDLTLIPFTLACLLIILSFIKLSSLIILLSILIFLVFVKLSLYFGKIEQ